MLWSSSWKRHKTTVFIYLLSSSTTQKGDRLLPLVQELFSRAWEIDPDKGLSFFPVSFEEIFRSMVLIGDWEWFDFIASNAHGAIPL